MSPIKKLTTLIMESEDYSERAILKYRSLGPACFWPDLKQREREEVKQRTNILVLMLKYHIDKQWIDSMPNLKAVATQTTGLNHIDTVHLKKKNIKLISLLGQKSFLRNITSTAEEAIALLLTLARNIPWAFEDVKSGNWNRNAWRGRQLLGKTFGILGFGRLGKIVAGYAQAFGMKVIACDPHVSLGAMRRYGATKVEIGPLFKESDALSIHVLLTDATRNLVKEHHLKMMKPTAYLINTARAELIEAGALERALRGNWIAGAGVDVMWNEKSDGSHLRANELVKFAKQNKNLIIVPHIGGATFEAMEITQDFLADLVLKHFRR